MIVRRRASSTDIFVPVAGSAMDCNNYELLMMTSATLIEALYEAVTDWLSENTPGKTSIVELSPAVPWPLAGVWPIYMFGLWI